MSGARDNLVLALLRRLDGRTARIEDWLATIEHYAFIISTQINREMLSSFRTEKLIMPTCVIGQNNTFTSTYEFMRDIIGHDPAGLFERSVEMLHM